MMQNNIRYPTTIGIYLDREDFEFLLDKLRPEDRLENEVLANKGYENLVIQIANSPDEILIKIKDEHYRNRHEVKESYRNGLLRAAEILKEEEFDNWDVCADAIRKEAEK